MSGSRGTVRTLNISILAMTLLLCAGATWLPCTAAAVVTQPKGPASDPLALLAVQQVQLTASDGATSDWFGHSVALSGDTALVGASQRAAAYVFVRSAGVWTQDAILTPTPTPDTAWGGFGDSVALSGDIALVRALGAAYVFVRSGGVWTQEAELAAEGGEASSFGSAAALSADGQTALVGAPTGGNVAQGAAYVFGRSAGVWTREALLTAPDGAAGNWFGRSVALSGDGATALIGAPEHDVGGNPHQGAAYVFGRSGGVWTQKARLTARDGFRRDFFGFAVALSGDTALVGAPRETINLRGRKGLAYVFELSGGVWAQAARLSAHEDDTGDRFGCAVALSGDTALVGAPSRGFGNFHAAAVCVFVRHGGAWTPQAPLVEDELGPLVEDGFGYSAFSGDGATALVGAPEHDVGGNVQQGVVYVFALDGPPDTRAPSTKASAATMRVLGTGETWGELKYVVSDPLPSIGAATVTIQIKKGAEIVATIRVGVRPTNTPLVYDCFEELKKGSYTWRVLATDLAGHAASRITPAKLTVK